MLCYVKFHFFAMCARHIVQFAIKIFHAVACNWLNYKHITEVLTQS